MKGKGVLLEFTYSVLKWLYRVRHMLSIDKDKWKNHALILCVHTMPVCDDGASLPEARMVCVVFLEHSFVSPTSSHSLV